ncbi:MAG: hypothetical protein OHK0057_14540 [Thermoflexibacter sp.]
MKLLENIFFSSTSHKAEKWIVLVLLALLWGGIFQLTGVLTSGFHLTDDHEIVLFNDLLKKQSAFSLIEEQVKIDLVTRFRPTYYAHRILITSLIGTNQVAWATYYCFLGILTSFFLYLALRKVGFSILESLLFPLFAFIGEQTAVWWRLGTAETLGMFFTALSLYFASNNKPSKLISWSSFLFLCFAILASLSKESFILLIPALLFWKMWVEKHENWQRAVKSNLLFILFLGVIALAEIYFIQVKTNAQGSIFNISNVEDSSFRNTILLYMLNKVLTFNQLHILFIVFLGILAFTISDDLSHAKKKLGSISQNFLPILIFTLLVLVPQFVLYSRTDLYERYLIPATVGLGFFAVGLLQLICKQEFIRKYLKIVFCVLGLLGLYFPFGKAYFKGQDFAVEGTDTQSFLQFIKSVTTEESAVLLVSEPVQFNEWTYSFYRFMQSSLYQRKNIYLQLYTIPNANVPIEIAESNKAVLSKVFEKQLFDFNRGSAKIKCIAILPFKELEQKLSKEKQAWLKEFGKNKFGNFVIYSK